MVLGSKTYSLSEDKAHYLFVDGAYVLKIIETISQQVFGLSNMPIRYDCLFQKSKFRKIFYYDCMPPKKNKESEEDFINRSEYTKNFFNSIREIEGCHVFEGRLTGSGRKARQKGVDVQLAIDMLWHTYQRNMERATLFAGDMDFKPLVDRLIMSGMHVILWYEPSSTSQELVRAVDKAEPIRIQHLHKCCKSDFVKKHPLPDHTVISKEQIENYKNSQHLGIWKKGKNSKGQIVEIYESGSTENFKFHLLVNLNVSIAVYRHNNSEFLEKYYQFDQNAINWDD